MRARLAGFDGRAVSLLGEAEAALGGEEGYTSALIELCTELDDNLSSGATWLLKSWLEKDRALDPAEVSALCDALPDARHWQAQLHLCQSIRFLRISAPDAPKVGQWLTPLLAHGRPFVRAWALDALGSLSRDHPQFRAAFEDALAQAERDEAASVRARTRNLRA